MIEFYLIHDTELKSGGFDKLLLIITFASAASVHRAMNASSGGMLQESNY